MSAYAGGCACGAIRYTVTGEPKFSFHCCCRQCQHTSGTGHTSLFVASGESLEITGDLTGYERSSASGNTVSQFFCPTCGSPVMSQNSGYPGMRYIHAASLDDPTRFVPEKVVWESEGQPWDIPGLDPSA